jgi:hypothetical protein
MNHPKGLKETYHNLLMSLLGKEALVERWWVSRNAAFDMKTPLDMYAEHPERVDQYIKDQFHG